MPRFIISSCAFIALMLGAMFAQGGAVEAQNAAPDGGPYRFGPGDSVDVTVLEDPSLNRQVLILPDGRISLPIVGTIDAAGKTPEELAARIRSGLGKVFVSPPTVTAAAIGLSEDSLKEEPEAIYVVGEVRNPGAFAFEKPMNVMQALSLAGGPGPFAARARIQVHRTVNDVVTVETFDYDALEDGRPGTLGPELQDGDVVIVPERSLFN